jgi:photosystem II stability/assembly factor-like uncharacterized protein
MTAVVALCGVVMLSVVGGAFAAGVYEWERMDGPYGGSVSNLRRGHEGETFVQAQRQTYKWSEGQMSWVPVPPSPSTLYEIDDRGSWYWLKITSIDRYAEVLRSDDEGETWQQALRFYGEFSWGPLTVSGPRVYVNTPGGRWQNSDYPGGLMVSADQGRSWIHAGTNNPRSWVVEGNTVYAAGGDGLSRSDDGGVSWRVIVDDEWAPYAQSLARHSGSLYAAAWRGSTVGPDAGLYRSDDDGATWYRLSDVLGDPGFRELLATPSGITATTERAGVLFSPDGLGWKPRNRGLPTETAQVEVVKGDIYADGRRSIDRGDTWEATGVNRPGEPTQGYRGSMVGHGPTRYYLLHDSNEIWSSQDAGRTWRLVLSGVDEDYFEFLAANGDRHFLVGDNNTYSTEDGGATLEVVSAPHTLPYRTSAVDWVGSQLYAGTSEGGVLRSVDAGVTWASRGAIADGPAVNAFTGRGERVLAGTGRGLFTAGAGPRAGPVWRQESTPSGAVVALTQRYRLCGSWVRSDSLPRCRHNLAHSGRGGLAGRNRIPGGRRRHALLWHGAWVLPDAPTRERGDPSRVQRPVASTPCAVPGRHEYRNHGRSDWPRRAVAVARRQPVPGSRSWRRRAGK